MELRTTKHQQKSALITTVILLLLLVAIFKVGMRYLDPPAEYGVAINFEDSYVGTPTPIAPKSEEQIPEPTKETSEDLITDASAKEVLPVKPVPELPKETPKPSKEAQDAFAKLLNNTTERVDSITKGAGTRVGESAEKSGALKANKYYEKSGEGTDLNYNLAGRKALSKPIEKPDCQQEGIVVVRITVAKNGKVIAAVPGVKGTTNAAQCLLKPAKEAALKTTWNVDNKAPENQQGTIIYKFTLAK